MKFTLEKRMDRGHRERKFSLTYSLYKNEFCLSCLLFLLVGDTQTSHLSFEEAEIWDL